MRSKRLGRHAGPRQHPRALHRRRGGDDEDAVELALGAGLVEQRDVEERRRRRAGVGRGEGGAVGGDERMDPRLDPVEEARVGRDRRAQPVAVDARRSTTASGARSASAAAPAAAGA